MSRRVRCFIAVSLDGFIADAQGEVDWLFTDEDYGDSDFIAGIDTLLIGRKTYEQVLGFGEWPYENVKTYVFTSGSFVAHANVFFVNEAPADFINGLKTQPGGDLWLVGGGMLNATCLRAEILDELILSVHPVLLGEGTPLFEPSFKRQNLVLQNSRTYESGMVQLTYGFKPVGRPPLGLRQSKAREEHAPAATQETETVLTTSPALPQSGLPQEETLETLTPSTVEAIPQIVAIPHETDSRLPSEETQIPIYSSKAPENQAPKARGASTTAMPFLGSAIGLGFLLGLLQVFASRLIDVPLLLSLLIGVGIGIIFGLEAGRGKSLPPRSVAMSALLCGFIAILTMQVGGAMLARPSIANHLAGVIGGQASERAALRASIESRLTPFKTLGLYRQMQSDPEWRTQYYGWGSQFKFSGFTYWLLQGVDALCLLGASAALALFLSKSPEEQRALRTKMDSWLEALRRSAFGDDRDEQLDTNDDRE